MITDLYRQSPFDSMAKGWSAIGFFFIDLCVASALLYKNSRRIVIWTIGVTISNAISVYVNPPPEMAVWKFGHALYVIPVVMLLSCYFYGKRQFLAAYVLIGGIAGYNLLQNFRSMFLIILIAGIIILPSSVGTRLPRRPPSLQAPRTGKWSAIQPKRVLPVRILVLVALVLIVAGAASKTYSYLASNGTLGEDAKDKYEMQSRGKFGLLVGGRPESLISWRAIVDSPILGHGSWPENEKYSNMLNDLEIETGYVEEEVDPRLLKVGLRLLPDSNPFVYHASLGVGRHSWRSVLGLHNVPYGKGRIDSHEYASPIGSIFCLSLHTPILEHSIFAVRTMGANDRIFAIGDNLLSFGRTSDSVTRCPTHACAPSPENWAPFFIG